MELAYSDLIQANLVYPGGKLLNFELPLFFLDPADPELSRTVWGDLRDHGRFHRPSDGDPVTWAVDQITDFLRRERRLALNMEENPPAGLDDRPGLLDRVTRFDPNPIP